MITLRSLAPIAVGILSLVSSALAAEPRLDALQPQGVRRGAEAVVKLVGPRLGADPLEIVFYEPGVTVTKLEVIDANSVNATLQLADDCPMGRHAVRLRTATGLSNLRTLHVGALEGVDEVEPNNQLDDAQAVPLDRTVHGLIQPEDEDVFAVEVAEGGRLSVEVEGIRLGRTFFDPVIEVLDDSGAVIAKSDDQPAAYQDGFLSLVAPKAGRYLVRLRESAFQGDGLSTYLLHIGQFPRPAAVFPPAAVAGQEVELRWIDDGGGETTQKVTIPAGTSGTFEAFASDEKGFAPSSLPVLITEVPPTLEAEPNDNRKEPNPMPAPGVVAGVVQAAGDKDHFRFTANKGQVFDLRVRAREMRSALDPVLRVLDTDGKRLAGNDDDRRNPDSYLRFTAPDQGDFVLQVEDRLGRGGPAFVYLVEAAAPVAAADITIDDRRGYEATVIEVPQGGATAVLAKVNRRDVGGELELTFDSLPPGVTAEAFPLAGDYNAVPVIFRSEPEAALAATLSPLSVRRTDTANSQLIESRFQQQNWLVRGRNNVSVWSHFTDRVAVAVTQRLPFSITVQQPKAPLCQNGSSNLLVKVDRDEGFDQAIRVYTLYHPPGFSSNRSLSIPKESAELNVPVTANGQARKGAWPMLVIGEINLNGRVYVSTPFVTLNIAEAYFDVSVPTVTALQGSPAEMVVSLSHRTPFEGAATLELVGLPPGVTAAPIEVAAGTESAKFDLAVAADAKPGRHQGVGVRVRLPVDGETVEYRHGYSEFRIDPPLHDQTAKHDDKRGGQSS